MNKEEKAKLYLLDWWKYKKHIFPSLFKAALACIHVPATSVPAEIIFSLAGYVVRDCRIKLLSDNVNKLIFLHQNIHVIREVPAPDFQRH